VTVFTRLAQRGQRRTEGGCQARITLHAVGAQVARLAELHAHRPRRHDRASLSQESPVPTGYGTSTARSHGRAMRDRNRAATPKLVVTQVLRVVRKSGVPAVVSSKVDENSFTRTYFFL
jgi:hypothetical protein